MHDKLAGGPGITYEGNTVFKKPISQWDRASSYPQTFLTEKATRCMLLLDIGKAVIRSDVPHKEVLSVLQKLAGLW